MPDVEELNSMSKLAEMIHHTVVPPGRLALCWLGGAGFVFKTASGRIVAVDPYLSDSLDHTYSWKRLPISPIAMAPAELQADLVLATHAHEDHLDPETIPELVRASQALVAGPLRPCSRTTSRRRARKPQMPSATCLTWTEL
jgi:L-ascorbate metabolism protein UlaG (beta-lactamase superfamily)